MSSAGPGYTLSFRTQLEFEFESKCREKLLKCSGKRVTGSDPLFFVCFFATDIARLAVRRTGAGGVGAEAGGLRANTYILHKECWL